MDATLVFGLLQDTAYDKMINSGVTDSIAKREAVMFAVKNTWKVFNSKPSVFKIKDTWNGIPRSSKLSRGRTELTVGLKDNEMYWVRLSGDNDYWLIARYEETDDYSGPGTFSFIGTDECFWPKGYLGMKQRDLVVTHVNKVPIVRVP